MNRHLSWIGADVCGAKLFVHENGNQGRQVAVVKVTGPAGCAHVLLAASSVSLGNKRHLHEDVSTGRRYVLYQHENVFTWQSKGVCNLSTETVGDFAS